MAIFLQDLDQRFPIVDPVTGQPTDYFLRLLRGQTGALGEELEVVEGELADKADKTTLLTAGAGLTGGGTLAADRTFAIGAGTGITVNADDVALANTAVTPGSYTNTDLTVDAQGRITAAANGSGGGGGGSAWRLVDQAGSTITSGTTWTYSSAVSSVNVVGLAGASEILVMCRGVTTSASGFRVVYLSVDNGASFYTTSGDYQVVAVTGAEAASGTAGTHSTATTSARAIVVHLQNANAFGLKTILTAADRRVFVASTAAVNAIQFATTAGNLTAGDLWVFVR